MAVHVVRRSSNVDAVFFDDNDYRSCLDRLREVAESMDALSTPMS